MSDEESYWVRADLSKNEDEAAMQRRSLLRLPLPTAFLASLMNILISDFGFARSQEEDRPILGNGEEIPMWSYGLIEYLMSQDLSWADVLEIGTGSSTVFLAKRVKTVTAVETDAGWAKKLNDRQLDNVETVLIDRGALSQTLAGMEGGFDIICIDPAGSRLECAKAVSRLLKPGGFIILDNSEWYPNTAEYLRSLDLIEIDMFDFRALRHYRTATSLFLHPDFRPRPNDKRMPAVPIGGRGIPSNGWD
ncbi:class I SAM-dependent methyltransferase [Hyphococcus sp.]|uniref:class I SAM-dependent methyltransferase n=1 Tax=Hyphococcus sp. TaxID=2038636 RepID=UPI0035C6781B